MGYSVYKLTSPSGKCYIGITSGVPEKRWNNGHGYHHNTYISSAIAKYGWGNFEKDVLFSNLSKVDAERIEIELIEQYQSCNRKYGYNILKGGDVSNGHTEETRRKISESVKALQTAELREKKRQDSLGRTHSLETREKLRQINLGNHNALGIVRSPETRKKMSDAQKGRKLTPEHIAKIKEAKAHISDETRRKMSEAAKNRHKGGKQNCQISNGSITPLN